MGDQLIPDLVLIAHNHHHVATGRNRVDDVRRPDESDLNFSGKHGLRRLRGNDENRLYIHIVLAEKALLLGDPRRRHVGVDRSVGKQRFRHRLRGPGQPS